MLGDVFVVNSKILGSVFLSKSNRLPLLESFMQPKFTDDSNLRNCTTTQALDGSHNTYIYKLVKVKQSYHVTNISYMTT